MAAGYAVRISRLREKKLAQTAQKLRVEGPQDEDDYGRVVPPSQSPFRIIPNHEDGSFYGLSGWSENFAALMEQHPVHVDPDDAFAGKWMYFLSRMRPSTWPPEHPYSHLRPAQERYGIIDGIGFDAHFAPDYQLGLQLGFGGLLQKLRTHRAEHGPDRWAFYDAHERVVLALQQWIRNTVAEIRRQQASEPDPALRQNLKEMAEVNERLVEQPPQTLREACQWIIWFHLASRTYNRDGAGGQLDALLWPYYQRDLAQGLVDEEAAVYYLACLLLNDPVYWQLGGPDPEGRDLTCRLSWLVLDAAEQADTSLNLTVRVHQGLCPAFFRRAVGCLLAHRNGWPRFSGDRALVEGFAQNGYPEQLARRRIAVGCNWMSLPGLEYTMNDLVKVNAAKVFEVALDELMLSGRPRSCELLWEGFSHHLQQAVHTAAEGIRFHLRHQKDNEPELLLNLLSHGPLEKGRDISDGGATYYHLAIDGAGLGTVADSFAALEQRVEKEQHLDWARLHRLLKEDWKGLEGERFRQLMRHSQRYCQGNGSLGDLWAQRISRAFTGQVRAQSDQSCDLLFIPGWFSWAHTLLLGEQVGATPDGRRAGQPISHGANPNPGFRQDGAPTAMARGIAQIQPGYGNTAPMQLELDPGLARQDQVESIGGLIRTHFELGGTLLNVNILDKQKLLEAHRDPSLHPDLVVRVTGFTAYFALLTPPFRQLVIDRLLEG